MQDGSFHAPRRAPVELRISAPGQVLDEVSRRPARRHGIGAAGLSVMPAEDPFRYFCGRAGGLAGRAAAQVVPIRVGKGTIGRRMTMIEGPTGQQLECGVPFQGLPHHPRQAVTQQAVISHQIS